jgi:Putative adhesin
MRKVRTRVAVAVVLPILLASVSACDIVTADFKAQDSAEWKKSYALQPGGRVEISNVNGKIDVQPSDGNTVDIVALKIAKAGSAEAARQALDRIEIVEASSPSAIKVETRLPRGGGFFHMGSGEVRYTVKVPASAEVRFTTVNGGIELTGLTGRINAETTNGGIQARGIGGPIEASTTNGGVDVELARVADPGVKLECTNGGIKLRLPSDARATISASVTNGGIDTGGLSLETTESSRRRLEGRLNGGGPAIRIEGTNGGIRIASR